VALEDSFCEICGDGVTLTGVYVWFGDGSHLLYNTYCTSRGEDTYTDLPTATAACDAEPSCARVYDSSCGHASFQICLELDYQHSDSSCLHSRTIDEECDDGANCQWHTLLTTTTADLLIRSLTASSPMQESSIPRSQTPTAAQTAAWQDAVMALLTAMRTATMGPPTLTPETRPAALIVRPGAAGMPLSTPTKCAMQVHLQSERFPPLPPPSPALYIIIKLVIQTTRTRD
jgi:hypothetical protein